MKRFFALLGVLSLLCALVAPAAAQEASPAATGSLLAAMGFPELHITAHDDSYEVPAQVDAGRTLIVFENLGQESNHALLVRLPEGVSAEEALASPSSESEEPPAWFADVRFPGFAGETLPGQTSYAVVDLAPGVHLILSDVTASFEVVGEATTPTAANEPAAEAMVELFEYGFAIPDAVAPGRQVWKVTNSGEMPHELLLVWSPEPVTYDQIFEMLTNESEDENATPVGGGPSFAEMEPVGGLGWLSPGAAGWTEVDLRPGTYVALCFVVDMETGMLHVQHGMIDVFTVGEAATPAS